MLKSQKIGMLKTTCITVMYMCIKIGLCCNTSFTLNEKQKYALQILIQDKVHVTIDHIHGILHNLYV